MTDSTVTLAPHVQDFLAKDGRTLLARTIDLVRQVDDVVVRLNEAFSYVETDEDLEHECLIACHAAWGLLTALSDNLRAATSGAGSRDAGKSAEELIVQYADELAGVRVPDVRDEHKIMATVIRVLLGMIEMVREDTTVFRPKTEV